METSKIGILIPTYNNCKTIGPLLRDIIKNYSGLEVVVVNDGSTDDTSEIISNINGINIVEYKENRGKGYALRAGFEKAEKLSCTNVITVDADGQHLVSDISKFIDTSKKNPSALVIGNRVIPYESTIKMPARSDSGRKFGNFWYKFITGIQLNDTQCGFRSYPLQETLKIKSKRVRYDYEQELLIRLAWNGVKIEEIPISLIYHSKEERVSHFNPIVDFMRISRVNAKYAALTIINPFVKLDVPGEHWFNKISYIVKRELKANTSPIKSSLSIATGIFFALSPFHGFQVLLSIGVAFLLKLNRPLTFLGVNASPPPLIPIIIIAEVEVGKFVIPNIILQGLYEHGKILYGGVIFIVGSLVTAAGVSFIVFIVLIMIISLVKKGSGGEKI